MTDLRTLKDLRTRGINVSQSDVAAFDDLKAEAVKWVKHCKHYNYIAEIGWIKTFFNLTEEDLK